MAHVFRNLREAKGPKHSPQSYATYHKPEERPQTVRRRSRLHFGQRRSIEEIDTQSPPLPLEMDACQNRNTREPLTSRPRSALSHHCDPFSSLCRLPSSTLAFIASRSGTGLITPLATPRRLSASRCLTAVTSASRCFSYKLSFRGMFSPLERGKQGQVEGDEKYRRAE